MKKTILLAFLALAGCNPSAGLGGPPQVLVASDMTVSEGQGQLGAVNRGLPKSLKILVTDSKGQPIEKIPVVLTPAAGSGTAYPSFGVTSEHGALVLQWQLGTTRGRQSIKATTNGAETELWAVVDDDLPAPPPTPSTTYSYGSVNVLGTSWTYWTTYDYVAIDWVYYVVY